MSRPAPYPAETRAKGWRFELDYEKIDQSDTWDLAGEVPLAQHVLLMSWFVAWKQTPCGSFPNNEDFIRAKCRVPPEVWATCRELVMRGWWLADDGRLYHDTITTCVVAMMTKRRSDADRAARSRAAAAAAPPGPPAPPAAPAPNPPGVTDESRVTPSEVGPEFATGTGTGTTPSPAEKKKAGRKRPAAPPVMAPLQALLDAGLEAKTATDFIAHKLAKNAPLTERAWKDHLREARAAGWSAQDAAEKVMAKDWKGFEAKYVRDERPAAGGGETAYQRSQRETVHQFSGGLVSKKAPGARPAAPSTMDVVDATPVSTTALAARVG